MKSDYHFIAPLDHFTCVTAVKISFLFALFRILPAMITSKIASTEHKYKTMRCRKWGRKYDKPSTVKTWVANKRAASASIMRPVGNCNWQTQLQSIKLRQGRIRFGVVLEVEMMVEVVGGGMMSEYRHHSSPNRFCPVQIIIFHLFCFKWNFEITEKPKRYAINTTSE